ncbi:MAG TPA: class E sortase [Egibacteraceae bacterium]|jgi:sortase A|nr:class E sortase [Egibacteraceae bacterium]
MNYAAPPPPAGGGLNTSPPLGNDRPSEGGRVASVIDALRTRPAARRALSTLSIVLFLAGAGMFAFPFATDIYADRWLQRPLEDKFGTDELRDQYANRAVRTGDPLTRIIIPRLGVDAMVVEGTSQAALRAGAGHYPNTPLPGEAGNVAIAGHRVTYGRPFNRMDELRVGDEIKLETPLAMHTYKVIAHPPGASAPCPNGACWVTHPHDWSVVDQAPGSILTLTTCHPKGSAEQRLILRAELVESVDRGPSAAMGG